MAVSNEVIIKGVICLILAIVAFKLKYKRIRITKLSNLLTWGIVIICGLVNTMEILGSGIMQSVLYGEFYMLTLYGHFRLIFLILLVINLISIDNKIKAVILSAAQFGMTLIAPVVILLVFLLFISGGAGAFAGVGGNSPTSDSTGYSYDQNTEARNKGYSNALDAERSGRKWNGSTWE